MAAAESTTALGPAEEIRVPRSGQLHLGFKGWLLNSGKEDPHSSMTIAIYRTVGNQFVTTWSGEVGLLFTKMESGARVHDSPTGVLDWLKNRSLGGKLSEHARKFWEGACQKDQELYGYDAEWVE